MGVKNACTQSAPMRTMDAHKGFASSANLCWTETNSLASFIPQLCCVCVCVSHVAPFGSFGFNFVLRCKYSYNTGSVAGSCGPLSRRGRETV